MLTSHLLSYYNHILATTVLYITIVDPIKDLANSYNQHLEGDHHRLPSLVSASSPESTDKDYYEILGVQKDATKQEIHKAFRQMARKYHPDKNKDKGAQDEFIKIFKAYETLSDEKKRKEYDNQFKTTSHANFNGWHHATAMNDFDIDEFFKLYEEQISKQFEAHHYHSQGNPHHHPHHHHQHHHQHHQNNFHTFHGISLDDLFHDIDQEEFQSFDHFFNGLHGHHAHHHDIHGGLDGSFGDGKSFFGSYLPSEMHDTIHQFQHQRHIHTAAGINHGGFSGRCHTTTKQVDGVVMTQTSCM